jgi:hypothetical protein
MLSTSTRKVEVLIDLGTVSQLLVVTSTATTTVIQCLSAQWFSALVYSLMKCHSMSRNRSLPGSSVDPYDPDRYPRFRVYDASVLANRLLGNNDWSFWECGVKVLDMCQAGGRLKWLYSEPSKLSLIIILILQGYRCRHFEYDLLGQICQKIPYWDTNYFLAYTDVQRSRKCCRQRSRRRTWRIWIRMSWDIRSSRRSSFDEIWPLQDNVA